MNKDKLLLDALPGLLKDITRGFEALGLTTNEAIKSLQDFNKAFEVIKNLDGRSTAWTPERRAKHANKVKEAAEARNAGHFMVWQWSDEAPKEFSSLSAAAAFMETTEGSLRVTRSKNKGLGVIKHNGPRKMMVLAQSKEDMQSLLAMKANKTGNPDDMLVLPAKNMKTY